MRKKPPQSGTQEIPRFREHIFTEGATYQNYERFSLRKGGTVIHFDPYQVGSYAEGKYEVFVPVHVLKSVVQEKSAALLAWQ